MIIFSMFLLVLFTASLMAPPPSDISRICIILSCVSVCDEFWSQRGLTEREYDLAGFI